MPGNTSAALVRYSNTAKRNVSSFCLSVKSGVRICLLYAAMNSGKADVGIVLIVAENPLTATWIPRNTNPSLVDDAIERFDNEFENSFNPEDVFASRSDDIDA